MADSSIEWTDKVWNCVRGCSMAKGSETGGCLNCYAARQAARNLPGFRSPTTGKPFARILPSGPRWTGDVELIESKLTEPLSWRKPQRIFVNSMSDLFHEALPDEAIDKVFAVMALAPQHTFQILTKRPARMKDYFSERAGYDDQWYRRVFDLYVRWRDEGVWTMPKGYAEQYALGQSVGAITCGAHDGRFLPNVWIGTSVENQATADERIPLLLQTPAAVRFISAEPLLSGIDIAKHRPGALGLHWVIVGGESGPGARACRPWWVRNIIGQCRDADVAVFVKQLGANILTRNDDGFQGEFAAENPREWPAHLAIEDRVEDYPHGFREDYQGADVRLHLRDRKGGDLEEWPMDLRVREFPNTGAAL